MRAGRLNKKITIQQATDGRSTSGAVEPTWSTYAVAWASVEPATGREFEDSDQVNAEASIKFRIRYKSGITNKMRISWDGRVFDITAVLNQYERNREIIIMAVEDVN